MLGMIHVSAFPPIISYPSREDAVILTRSAIANPFVFSLRQISLHPVHAAASYSDHDMEMATDMEIATRDGLTTLRFPKLRQALKYQHAVTDFRVYDYTQWVLSSSSKEEIL